VQRFDGGDRRHAGALAPGEEVGGAAAVGAARVRVADIGGDVACRDMARCAEATASNRTDRVELQLAITRTLIASFPIAGEGSYGKLRFS